MKIWEPVLDGRGSGGYPVDRLRVPGGWLYRDLKTSTMCFVPWNDEEIEERSV